MRFVNNTAAMLHWTTTFAGGGGDCGDLAPGAPPYEYKVNQTPMRVTFSLQPISYEVSRDDVIIAVASRMDTDPSK